ncbi:MAG: thioredoxin family protein, partial [Phycisphaerales bacterium]|nr:thioredoxin family protein [Phycisphaerales bacterium]
MRRILSLIVLACFVVAAPATPEFFSEKPYAEAKAFAAEHDKLFFVKGTAEWCGPCKQMDRTTFKDEGVVKWLTAHAVSVSVDVDKLPKIARELGIRAMPTVILFKGDEELGRVVGYRDGRALLAWLKKPASDPPPATRTIRPTTEPVKGAANAPPGIRARLTDARAMTRRGEHEKATEEFVWLWRHMLEHDPDMHGVRLSFMASDMRALAGKSEHAEAAFRALRDETERHLVEGPRTFDGLFDWLTLNIRVLGDNKPVLAWIERVEKRPTATKTFSRVRHHIDDMLIKEGRWDILG